MENGQQLIVGCSIEHTLTNGAALNPVLKTGKPKTMNHHPTRTEPKTSLKKEMA